MVISNLKIIEENNWSKLQADVAWGNDNFKTVFISVPSEFSKELDVTCADNFLIGLMLLAIKKDEDIYIKGSAVSKTLVENIYNILIPELTKMGCGTGKTKIHSEFMNECDQIRGARGATGISLGVDSFYSILRYKDSEQPIDTVLYVRGPKGDIEEIEQNVQRTFDVREKVADELSLRFIPVFSNLVSLMNSVFVFEQYHTYHNLAMVLTIKSINYYYYATAFRIDEMQPCFDSAGTYDYITSRTFSHSNFSMKMAGDDVTRYEKTEFISDNSTVQNNLDVCLNFKSRKEGDILNCSKCSKCVRTLATLEILGTVSKFDKIFDIDYYYNNKSKVWGDLEYKKNIMHDKFAKDIILKAKSKNFKLPLARWFVFLSIGIRNQFMKVKRKLKL